jgi:hypothetical protein
MRAAVRRAIVHTWDIASLQRTAQNFVGNSNKSTIDMLMQARPRGQSPDQT